MEGGREGETGRSLSNVAWYSSNWYIITGILTKDGSNLHKDYRVLPFWFAQQDLYIPMTENVTPIFTKLLEYLSAFSRRNSVVSQTKLLLYFYKRLTLELLIYLKRTTLQRNHGKIPKHLPDSDTGRITHLLSERGE